MQTLGPIQRIITWGAIALLIFGFHWFGVLDPLYDWTRVTLSPFTRTFYRGNANQMTVAGEGDEGDLQDQIRNLLVENTRLRTELDDIKALEGQLDFLKNTQIEGIQAKIIGNATDNFAKLLIINKGSGDGIRKGQGVVAGEGYLVGTISSVEEHTAYIRPLTDSQTAIAAKVQNKTSSPGVVKGRHGLSVHMELIPQTENIQVGQRIVTSELMDNTPPDILIGVIETIEFDEGELFQSATISPLYDESTLRVVTIL